MKDFLLLSSLLTASFFCDAQQNVRNLPAYPLAVPEQNSLMARWEKKPVLQSRLIDDMEQDGRWNVTGIGQMNYTQERAKDGKRSLRFSTSVRDTAYLALAGNKTKWGSQYFNISGQAGASSIQLRFGTPQDWSAFNRISFWVYVHPSTLPRHNLNLSINNEGMISNALTTSNTHYNNNLKPGKWNHVLFEMPHLPRNTVTMFGLTRELTGNNPGEDDVVVYDIDRLELQRVETDQFEGWAVSPEKFSFSHIGYRPRDSKIAMVGSGTADKFQLINQKGSTVFNGSVKLVEDKNGAFHQLDFSKFRTPGVYRIRCGTLLSNSFPIKEAIWLDPVFKSVNFYFCQRCGYDVPGIHKACHMDWQGFKGDVKKVINGGWHDAGDLSQGSWRTAMATFALMNNLELFQQQKGATEVVERMRSEIAWGLQYLLKTRFGDGYHIHWCRMRMFTDNIVGTVDDVVVPAENVPWENFLAAAVECRAATLLEKPNPDLARGARTAALDDWKAAVASKNTWDQASVEEASWGVTSSLLLRKMTGEKKYNQQAVLFGNLLTQCQEQHFVAGIPVTGYFYTNTSRQKVIHNKHTAFEEAPMIALSMLCKELPQNKNWMAWYSSAVLYSEFFMKRGSQIAAPYNLLPNSVWTKAEIMEDKNEKSRETSLQQFNDGTRLNDEYVLRTFPIWSDATFHGNTNVQLSNTWALAEASRLRRDSEGMQLVAKQLEWVLGANPFGQSLMYGVGYDYAPQFAYCLKNEVGSLPVGMDCRAGDKPYWPPTNSATYKEMWMEPVSRFLGAVSVYAAQAQSEQPSGKNIIISTQTTQSANGKVSVTITLSGTGKHHIEIKAFNANAGFGNRHITLVADKAERLQLELTVEDRSKPYIAVVSVDKNSALRQEIVGSYNDASVLAIKN